MRITGGSLKGKNIFFIKSLLTRPLKDSVKENIFNILAHSNLLNIEIKNSNILDLYSGIGSFGLECISRGASKITFVEKEKKVVEILNKNLLNLEIQHKSNVIINSIINFLENQTFKKFDLIFLDPPFAENTYLEDLHLIRERKIYKDHHIVIIHRERKTNDDFKELIKPLVIKTYGRSKIIFGKLLP